MDYISKKIGDRNVIWFKRTNKYLFLKDPAFAVWILDRGGLTKREIAAWCSQKFCLPSDKAKKFVFELLQSIREASTIKIRKESQTGKLLQFTIPDQFYSVKHYKINTRFFCFCFESFLLESLFHSLFEHLENRPATNAVRYFFFISGNKLVVRRGKECLGNWSRNEFHLAKGKLYMEILHLIYQTEEKDWTAIFHASAISNGNQCLIFPGGTGCGKSFLAAVLQKFNYKVVADDFVPVGAKECKAFNLPATISIKPEALKILSSFYPQLSANDGQKPATHEYRLIPEECSYCRDGVPIKAVIFIKYDKKVNFRFQKISQDLAFERLIADSWISPLGKNVSSFMDWISTVPCCQMVYSDNQLMVKKVNKLFK